MYVSLVRKHPSYKSREWYHIRMHMYLCMYINCQQGIQMLRFEPKSDCTPNESHMNVSTLSTPHTTPYPLLCSDLFYWARTEFKRVSYAISLPPLQQPSTCHPQFCWKSNFKYKICIHKYLWRGCRGALCRRCCVSAFVLNFLWLCMTFAYPRFAPVSVSPHNKRNAKSIVLK